MPPDLKRLPAALDEIMARLPGAQALDACITYLVQTRQVSNAHTDVWLTLYWPEDPSTRGPMKLRLHWLDQRQCACCVDTPFDAAVQLQ